jgi:hypothetical protein
MSRVSADQLRYATLLSWGTRLGIVILTGSFAAYVFGLLPAFIPVERMPSLWTLPAHEYLDKTGTGTGWYWISRLANGEFASLLGIATLAACSIAGLGALIPDYVRRRDFAYAVICLLSIAVVLLAASGALNFRQ